jgi:hypothetical protein
LIQPPDLTMCPTINCAFGGEGALCCGYQYVVSRERDCGAMRGMKARIFDCPGCSSVGAGAEPDRGGCGNDARTVRMRTDLMNVAIDGDGGLPG